MYVQIQDAIPRYLAALGRDAAGDPFVDDELEALQIPRQNYIDAENLQAASQLSGDQQLMVMPPPPPLAVEDADMQDVLPLVAVEKEPKLTAGGEKDRRVRGNRDDATFFGRTYHKIKAVAGACPEVGRRAVSIAVNPQTLKLVVCIDSFHIRIYDFKISLFSVEFANSKVLTSETLISTFVWCIWTLLAIHPRNCKRINPCTTRLWILTG